MLDLHRRLASEWMPHVKTALQHQIVATDREIDRLVYKSHGVTEM